jgi:hypothetical protein
MSVQVATKIPFRPHDCESCQHYYTEINRCRAYLVESWPKPLLGIFSGESEDPCEKYNPKTPSASESGETMEGKKPDMISAAAIAPPPLPANPAEIRPANEPRIHCPKCKGENVPDQVRCAYCRANLLPGEGLTIRLVTFVVALLAAGFFGRLAYVLITDPTRAPGIFEDPIKPAFIAVGLLISGVWFLVRKTPRYVRYVNRADRHLALNLNQSVRDYSQALEFVPQKERAEILKKRAGAFEKLGRLEDATRDEIAYTYEQGAYAFGSNLTGLFGGDRESYALSRSKTERGQLLSSGRAIAIGYCPGCKDAIQLTEQLRCPIHPKGRIQESRLFVPSEIDFGRQWILETQKRKRFRWINAAIRWAVILGLAWFAWVTFSRVFLKPMNPSKEIPQPLPAEAGLITGEVAEASFDAGGVAFAYPSDWEIVSPSDRQELLRTTLKGLGEYENISGVYTGGVGSCESCAHMIVVIIEAPETGPLTQEQYERARTQAQDQMGSRLLEHQMKEINGVPAAVSRYIGKSRETQQWDVMLLVPGENRLLMFSCSARPSEYERFEPIFSRAMESLAFEFGTTGSSIPTSLPEGIENTPVSRPVAVVDRSGSSINVRSGPGTSFTVVGGLPRDSQVEVLGRNQAGDWLKISEPSGWIFAELVSLSVSVENLPILE